MRAAPITALLAAALAMTACGTTAKHEPAGAVPAELRQRAMRSRKGGLSPVAAAPNLYDLHPSREPRSPTPWPTAAPGMPRRLLVGGDLEQAIDYILQETSR